MWPAELEAYDPARWPSEAAWRLARAHHAPSTRVALDEIRAAVARPGLGGLGRVI